MNTPPNIEAIDLFCGAGGLSYGLAQAGIDVRLGVDLDPMCEYPYTKNNEAVFIRRSVEEVEVSELMPHFQSGSLKLLAGCAPCQTFSAYNTKATEEDKRWNLLYSFAGLVKKISPEFVTMENVPRLARRKVFHDFLGILKDDGYQVSYEVVDCTKYGIPQSRRRLVLLASRLGEIQLLPPKEGTEKKTVRETIGYLPEICAGETDSHDPLHRAASMSPLNMKRMEVSQPGGSWKEWPEELIADCHKRSATYPSVYGRMEWDRPAPTITTQFLGFGNGRFGHPEQNRGLSIREGALLQGFPERYEFTSSSQVDNKKALTTLIGNAVPPKLGQVIGESFLSHLSNHV